MNGFYFQNIEELLISEYGEHDYRKIVAHAGIEEDYFISNNTYPDDYCLKLASSTANIAKKDIHQVQFSFGYYWFKATNNILRNSLMMGANKLKPLLHQLPEIFARFNIQFPFMNQMKLEIAETSAKTILITYQYPGQVAQEGYFQGFLNALGDLYKEKIKIDIIHKPNHTAEKAIFKVQWL